MTELTERLSSALADRYRIERHLGEGGMAALFPCALIGALLMSYGHPATAQTIALQCGEIIDGVSSEPLGAGTIVVEGDRIVNVSLGSPRGSMNGEAVDLSDATCLPGLIDAHAHPLIATDDYQVDHLRLSSGAKALRALRVLKDMLGAGWTTVRIAGDADVYYAHLDVRRAIDDGMFVGPRVTGAGHYLSITGGGGDINFIGPEQRVVADGRVVDGADDIRLAVREEVKFGSDWIKVLASGAFMSAGDDPRRIHFSDDEFDALMGEANRLGVPVMAHAHSTEAINRALEAGVRSIEHGTFLDARGIALLKERGAYLVPTMYIREYYLQEVPESEAQAKMVELSRRYRADNRRRISAAIAAGVKVTVGTDYVGWPVEYGVRELAELASLGMTPMQAIQAATSVNAELLGWEDRIGSIEAGKLADIIAVPGNPLQDLSTLERVRFVMIGGVSYPTKN